MEYIRSDNLIEDTTKVLKAFLDVVFSANSSTPTCLVSLFESQHKRTANPLKYPELVIYSPVYGQVYDVSGHNIPSGQFGQMQEIVFSCNLSSSKRADDKAGLSDGFKTIQILDSINRVFNTIQNASAEYYKTLPFTVILGGTTYANTYLSKLGVQDLSYSDMQPLNPFELDEQITFFTISLLVNRAEDAFRLV